MGQEYASCGFWVPGHELRVPVWALAAREFRLLVAGSGLWIADSRLWTRVAGAGLWVTDFGLWVSGFGMWVAGCESWVAGFGLRVLVGNYGLRFFELRVRG